GPSMPEAALDHNAQVLAAQTNCQEAAPELAANLLVRGGAQQPVFRSGPAPVAGEQVAQAQETPPPPDAPDAMPAAPGDFTVSQAVDEPVLLLCPFPEARFRIRQAHLASLETDRLR